MKQIHQTIFGIIHADIEILPLRDLVFFQEGPGLRKWQWTDSGMKVINGRNILLDHSIDLSNTNKYISLEEFNKRYSHFAIEPGDIVVTSSGTIGKVGRINMSHLPLMMNTSVIRFQSLDSERLDVDYLYAFLRSKYFHNQVNSYATGAAQQNFGPLHLKQMKILVPSIRAQRKIVSILSAYDELIDNNARRLSILEEMAQAIYREWFVNFRFPGYQNVKYVESSLGLIPEGWNVTDLSDCCKLIMGQSPKSEYYNKHGEGLPFHQGVTNFGLRYPTHKTYCTMRKRLANKEDILFSVRAPVGRINIANEEIILGRGVSAIRRKDEAQVFLFYQLKNKFNEVNIMGSGTIFNSVTKKDLLTLPLLNPPAELVIDFESKVGPSFKLYDNLTRKNNIIRTTRDLLLRKLISGELDVENLDIKISKIIAKFEEGST